MCFVLNWPGMEDLELISGQGTENNIFFLPLHKVLVISIPG